MGSNRGPAYVFAIDLMTEPSAMTIADITLAIFTLCNSIRVLAYAPQLVKAATDKDGAQAISLATWGPFLLAHLSAAAYATVNKADWAMAFLFLGNAVGSGAILAVAAAKRWQHRKRAAAKPESNVVQLPLRRVKAS